MKLATYSKAESVRITLCALAINALATLGSAEAQSSDAELAILRAREAGNSMELRNLEQKLQRLEQSERRKQPFYGFDDFVLGPHLNARKSMPDQLEKTRNARAVSLFLKELAAAEQQGLNMHLVLRIIELAQKYPDALTDATLKHLVDVATVEAQTFVRASNNEKRKTLAQSDLRTIAGQLRLYQSDNGSLPTAERGLDALVAPPMTNPKPSNWRQLLERVPLDPWGEPYIYRPDGEEFQIASKGQDREEGNEDDLVFLSSAQEKK